ncbi:MAG: hypothetical protein IT334_11315 [Thermomicrobiales bacterium]|nr:hypothetical protein [Thermomicrobiales bacterium]
MPDSRNNRLLSAARSIALITALLAAAPAFSAGADSGTPDASEVPTPMSQATTDDVVFSLITVDTSSDSAVEIGIRAENRGDLPVRLESNLIELSVETAEGATDIRPLQSSAPKLPCSIGPGETLAVVFAFELEPGDTAPSVSIGLVEINRSGAMVIFPLAPGVGASAIGGSGQAGANAGGTPTANPTPATQSATPGASPEADTCSK